MSIYQRRTGGSFKGQDSEVVSPIHERSRSVTESTLKVQAARTARDRVLEALADGRYHSAYELDHIPGLKPGDWVICVRELIDFGYAFDRRSNSLVIRRRPLSEKGQDLADLLARIDATVDEDVNVATGNVETRREKLLPKTSPRGLSYLAENDDFSLDEAEDSSSTPDFDLASDVSETVEEGDRVLVSVEPNGFVLSGKSLLTSTQAILARKRSGKTYLAMVLAEQLLKLGLPFVAVDPTGVWGGLRTLSNGTPSPYDLMTLGGSRGVRPLSPEMGPLVAKLVVEGWPRSVVLDLSLMEPQEQHRFVGALCTSIYTINRRPVHFFFDEADEYAPQTPESASQRRCLSAVDRFVRRGGVKGLGGTLITQRPAVINKNVLSQVGRLLILNLSSPYDIEAVDEWIKKTVTSVSARAACLSALPGLRQGEAFSVSVGGSHTAAPLVKFMTREKETFDSSRTPTMDEVDLPIPDVSEPSSEWMSILDRVFETGASDGEAATE